MAVAFDDKTEPRGLGAKYWRLLSASVISNIGDGIGSVAYPWLASAVTRNPFLIAMVLAVQRLPWLLFTLPAGVLTDRVDRRKAMVWMDVLRGVFTLGVALAVLSQQDALPGPDDVESIAGTNVGLYVAILLAAFGLGSAEVLRDNSAQTILPAIVHESQLEKANGKMMSTELVANYLVGPPIGSLLLVAAFSIPFFVDAGSFLVAAALVALIPGTFRAVGPEVGDVVVEQEEAETTSMLAGFKRDFLVGWRWLRGHSLLWPMALVLGLMNSIGLISFSTFVLFAQEVLGIGPLLFTVLSFGNAFGGFLGGSVAAWFSKRYGPGTCLAVVLGGLTMVDLVIFAVPVWPVVLVMFTFNAFLILLWNVIIVSLRQTLIPSHLLGRVNSVYRFLAWGMMPIGLGLGGLTVMVVEPIAGREAALRATFLVGAVGTGLLFLFGRAKLSDAKIAEAKAATIDLHS